MVTQVDGHALFEQQPVEYPTPDSLVPQAILEIGPGPGVGTFELLQSWPEAHLTCLEPGDVPRGALLWRLRDRELLGPTSRVEVLPLTFAEAAHLGRFDVIAAHHVVCEFDAELRREFWAFVHDHLADDGEACVDSHMGPAPGPDVPFGRRAEAAGPRHVFERWFGAETSADDAGRVSTTEYHLLASDGTIVQTTRSSRFMPYFDPDVVRQEVADANLDLDDRGRWWIITRRA